MYIVFSYIPGKKTLGAPSIIGVYHQKRSKEACETFDKAAKHADKDVKVDIQQLHIKDWKVGDKRVALFGWYEVIRPGVSEIWFTESDILNQEDLDENGAVLNSTAQELSDDLVEYNEEIRMKHPNATCFVVHGPLKL